MGLALGVAEQGFIQQRTLGMADVVDAALAQAGTRERLANALDLTLAELAQRLDVLRRSPLS